MIAPTKQVAACSVVTRNYLADGRLAARSFLDHHPDSLFYLLIADGDFTVEPNWSHDRVRFLTPLSAGVDRVELLKMAAIYSPFELACALKPIAVRAALAEFDRAIYVDGDVETFSAMTELVEATGRHSVVLVPHLTKPMPRDGCLPDEMVMLGAGQYNGGLIGFGPGCEGFIDWWEERLRRFALGQPEQMMLADQRWLDFVPSLFDYEILQSSAYDVAYWNLHERAVTRDGSGRPQVDASPLRCFHFSGLDARRPWLLSTFIEGRERTPFDSQPVVKQLCNDYLDSLDALGVTTDRQLGYHWSATSGGQVIDHVGRTLTRDALLAAEAAEDSTLEPPSPFGEDGGERWLDWLREPASDETLGRYLDAVRNQSLQLQSMFPRIPGPDAIKLRRWVASSGADSANIVPEMRTPPPDLPEASDLASEAGLGPRLDLARPWPRAREPVAGLEAARAALEDRSNDEEKTLTETAAIRALTEAVTELAQRFEQLNERVEQTNDAVVDLHDAQLAAHQAQTDTCQNADKAMGLAAGLSDEIDGLRTALAALDRRITGLDR